MGVGRRRAVLGDLVFPEAPRWHDGRLWFSDIHAHRIIAMTPEGQATTVAQLDDAPSGLGFLPDGTPMVAMMRTCTLLRLRPGGQPVVHADLSAAPGDSLNDMVVDGAGRSYVGCRQDPNRFGAGRQPAGECVALVRADGTWRIAAEDLVAPNGMAIDPGGASMVVAETRAHRLTAFDIAEEGGLTGRRLLAPTGEAWPDGICLDADGALWVAGGLAGVFLRMEPGGRVTETVDVPGCWALACVLGGDDRRTLYCLTAIATIESLARLRGPEDDLRSDARGQVSSVRVAVPGAGWP